MRSCWSLQSRAGRSRPHLADHSHGLKSSVSAVACSLPSSPRMLESGTGGRWKMEHRIHFTRREQQNTLQSHLLVPVSINCRSPLPFCVEPSRSKTLVSARTIETMGLTVDDWSSTLSISEKLAYPLLRLDSVAVGSAVLNNFEVVVWGSPAIPPDILANLGENTLYSLGNHPSSAIEAIIECSGVLGADFLRNFTVSLDFVAEMLVLER